MNDDAPNIARWISRLTVSDRRVLLAASRHSDPAHSLLGELLAVLAVDIRLQILREDRRLAELACREGLSDIGTWEP